MQVPLSHAAVAPALEQRLPHSPQFSTSDMTSTHAPSHASVFVGHVATQPKPLLCGAQNGVAPSQTASQSPQLVRLFLLRSQPFCRLSSQSRWRASQAPYEHANPSDIPLQSATSTFFGSQATQLSAEHPMRGSRTLPQTPKQSFSPRALSQDSEPGAPDEDPSASATPASAGAPVLSPSSEVMSEQAEATTAPSTTTRTAFEPFMPAETVSLYRIGFADAQFAQAA